MAELIGLPYSPWSEMARFALDVRGVPYRPRHYAPLIGEPALRLKLGRITGPVTVPVMVCDDGKVLADSSEIARWADTQGQGPTMFPEAHESSVTRFVELAQRGLNAGRGLSLLRTAADREALLELVPRQVRKMLGNRSIAIARWGVHRTRRKYGLSEMDVVTLTSHLIEVLDQLREALDATQASSEGPSVLLGELSFADIAMAQTLAFVAPPTTGLRIGPASRRCFQDVEVRDRYPDLIAWRDALYAAYR